MKKFFIFLCSFLIFAIIASQVMEYIQFQESFKNQPAITISSPEERTISISISAVGDCFFGADEKYAGAGDFNDVIAQNGNDYSYCFKNVKEYFEADDFTIVNYEGCISDKGVRADKEFAFRTNPDYVKFLTESSVEAANLSNNHSRDYGEASFEDTKNILTENGIINFAGSDVAIAEKDGIRIGFVGTNTQRYSGKEEVIQNINLLKEENVDLLIAVFHWGDEREALPNEEQINLAHTAIDNGADLVLGHHPHVLQGIESYNGKYIVYSLGNFSFGGIKNPYDKDTMIFNQVFYFRDGKLLDIDNTSIIPCSMTSAERGNNYQPTPLFGDEFTRVKEKIIERSKDFEGIHSIRFIEG